MCAHDSIGVILFGSDVEIKEGSRVVRTGKTRRHRRRRRHAGPRGRCAGRSHRRQGRDQAPMTTGPSSTRPPASSPVRPSISLMQTGILAIDSMFPIGRGQRELIIGDRQTGKTAHGRGHHSEPEGQRMSSASMWPSARRPPRSRRSSTPSRPMAPWTTPSWSPPLRQRSRPPCSTSPPTAGAAIGEHFMDEGKDVLIVYDDLSKHAHGLPCNVLCCSERSPRT